jgi:hypothetical protein
MTGLARKIGDLVHDTRIDRISDPLNKSRGKRGEGAEGGKWRKLIREEFCEEKGEEVSISRRMKSPFSTGMIGGGRRRMEWCWWTRALWNRNGGKRQAIRSTRPGYRSGEMGMRMRKGKKNSREKEKRKEKSKR